MILSVPVTEENNEDGLHKMVSVFWRLVLYFFNFQDSLSSCFSGFFYTRA